MSIRATQKNPDGSYFGATYDTLEEFLEDCLEDEGIISILTDLYGEVEIPLIGMVPAGDAIFKFAEGDNIQYRPAWDVIFADILTMELDYLEDEISSYGKAEYYGYTVTDTEWVEED